MHRQIEGHSTILTSESRPNPQAVTTRHATQTNIEEEPSITQQQDFNIFLGLEPANNLLPMERFRLCHPRDSAVPYDIIQSRSMFGHVTVICQRLTHLYDHGAYCKF